MSNGIGLQAMLEGTLEFEDLTTCAHAVGTWHSLNRRVYHPSATDATKRNGSMLVESNYGRMAIDSRPQTKLPEPLNRNAHQLFRSPLRNLFRATALDESLRELCYHV